MNGLDFLMGMANNWSGDSPPPDLFRFRDFDNRRESWVQQNKLILRYRETGDENAFLDLIDMMIPLFFSTMKKSKFTDMAEFRLTLIEVFTKAVNEYRISDDPRDMLFSGYLQMQFRYATLNHLNNYVEDRTVVISLEAADNFNSCHFDELFEGEDEITDIRFYLALDKLTKRERQVITMHFFEGKGEHEIIEELGIGEKSFPVYLSKSKTAFRKAYTEVLELDLLQLSDEEMEL